MEVPPEITCVPSKVLLALTEYKQFRLPLIVKINDPNQYYKYAFAHSVNGVKKSPNVGSFIFYSVEPFYLSWWKINSQHPVKVAQ